MLQAAQFFYSIRLNQNDRNGFTEPNMCKKKIFNWCQNHSSWFRMERMTPYRVIRTTTKKQTAFIQGGEDLCGSRVGLETSHTGEIGYWPDPDLSRHGARAHCWWRWEADASHWCLVTTQGLKTTFIQYYKTFWQNKTTLNLFKYIWIFPLFVSKKGGWKWMLWIAAVKCLCVLSSFYWELTASLLFCSQFHKITLPFQQPAARRCSSGWKDTQFNGPGLDQAATSLALVDQTWPQKQKQTKSLTIANAEM